MLLKDQLTRKALKFDFFFSFGGARLASVKLLLR